MDIATLVGIIGSFTIVISAIVLGGSAGVFINPSSILIVIGGSLFVVLMKFNLHQFLAAMKVAAKAFVFKLPKLEDMIVEIVELADVARKGGLLALEGKEVSNDFMQKGIQYLVDGYDPDVVKTMLNKDMKLGIDRHEWGKKIFQAVGDVGPAMGMIGTLIGLVQMLSNMDDPKAIGPAMAVALLTTLYGAMLATMVALPIADKLSLRMSEEGLLQALIIDALLSIQAGQNPRVIEGVLKTYLPEKSRKTEDDLE